MKVKNQTQAATRARELGLVARDMGLVAITPTE